MLKLCFIDCETSGRNPETAALLQIAGHIDVLNGGKVIATEKFGPLNIRPHQGAEIDMEALATNGFALDQIEAFPISIRGAHETLCDIFALFVDKFDRTDKMYFVGYCADFDNKFVRKLFDRCGDTYFGSWFWNPLIDLMPIAAMHLFEARPTMPNFQLMTVAEALHIPVDRERAHDAGYDIDITRKIFYRLHWSDSPNGKVQIDPEAITDCK